MDEKKEEIIEELQGSLRRAEHSYYVSLKYTRTVDVIRTLIERLSLTIKYGLELLAYHLYVNKKIEEVPSTLIETVNVVKESYEDPFVNEVADMMLFLRRVLRAEYTGSEEYRRHVEMQVVVEGEEHKFNIDNLVEYYEKVREFVLHTRTLIKND